jgi:hypothetical protein
MGGAVAHVELSLSEAYVSQAPTRWRPASYGGLARWSATAATADETCLVIDRDLLIVAVSVRCGELLGVGDPAEAVGCSLVGALRLIDFTAAGCQLDETEIDKIPPVLAITSRQLARGLMRVQTAADSGTTVDAIATPLLDNGDVAGSLTFFAKV